jgi:hypothetical protein
VIHEAELEDLLQRTQQAIDSFDLDSTDSRNVARYDKLVKLVVMLSKRLDKKKEPEPVEEALAL